MVKKKKPDQNKRVVIGMLDTTSKDFVYCFIENSEHLPSEYQREHKRESLGQLTLSLFTKAYSMLSSAKGIRDYSNQIQKKPLESKQQQRNLEQKHYCVGYKKD